MVKRNSIRFLFLGLVILLALPLGWGTLTGLSFWFSPFLMLNSILVLKTLVVLNIIGFIIIVITWFRKRWFCNYLCPAGFILEKTPRRENSKTNLLKFPHAGKWFVIISLAGALFGLPVFFFLDPILILNGFFIITNHPFDYAYLFLFSAFPLLLLLQYLIPSLWCERLCPLGGLQLIVSDLKVLVSGIMSKQDKVDTGRRFFIGGTLGAVAAIVLPKRVDFNADPVIRPPGSIKNFTTLCIRCGSCIKACPTRILTHNPRIGFGLMTPVVRFGNGYCLETCNRCSVVCPSGSITLFSVEAKGMLRIARTVIDQGKCLLLKFKECGICKGACPFKAINIIGSDRNSLLMLPEINQNICNGCGACIAICPENCFNIYSDENLIQDIS